MDAFLARCGSLRKRSVDHGDFDLLVIGAGVNGAGIARDAAGRGLNVALIDAGDIGGATSSASTKLIHGGLRYLEFYEFGLVRKALGEREVLLDIAAHLTRPMPFVLPLGPHTRPAWMVRAGLFLYDHLAKREQVPGSHAISLRDDHAGQPLDKRFKRAFRYWDGWVDDSRLVVANARSAREKGALVRTRTAVVSAARLASGWSVTLEGGDSLQARYIVNTAGPWAGHVAQSILQVDDAPQLKLVQGAHIITRRIGRGQDSYMLQQPDGRVVFVIPYETDFSLIGTTETQVDTPASPQITEAEITYLLEAANRYLARPLERSDIVADFAGIRPLVLEPGKSARETTRDWRLVEHADGGAMTVVGGKITTYRLLAEAVLTKIAPDTHPWTAHEPLPGNHFPRPAGLTAQQALARWRDSLRQEFTDYDPRLVDRLVSLYGTDAEAMLSGGLGDNLGGIFSAELEYLVQNEWATSSDDVLWRRTKLGLHLDPLAKSAVEDWFAKRFTNA